MYKEQSKKHNKRGFEQLESQRRHNKENLQLKANYDNRKDRKFIYPFTNQKANLSGSKISGKKQANQSKDQELVRLRKELQEQRQKVKYLQNTIIQQQSLVLKHLQLLQKKFYQVTAQKNQLEEDLNQIKNVKNHQDSQSSQFEEWRDKYLHMEEEHKKVKKIAEGLVKMMKKVDGVDGDVHQAWKWVKKVVWQYEGIRTKALEWKSVYDQINQAVNLIQK